VNLASSQETTLAAGLTVDAADAKIFHELLKKFPKNDELKKVPEEWRLINRSSLFSFSFSSRRERKKAFSVFLDSFGR
jgi:hypothetical protein